MLPVAFLDEVEHCVADLLEAAFGKFEVWFLHKKNKIQHRKKLFCFYGFIKIILYSFNLLLE